MSSAYDIIMKNRKELVEQLISQMEKGYAHTKAAWNKGCGRPYNPVSNAIYKGGNSLRLMIAAMKMGYSDPRWLTFKQASENHYKIAKGAKGVLLEKWIFHKEEPVLDESQNPVLDGNGKPLLEKVPLKKPIVNYFRVFNGEQVIGLPELLPKEVTEDEYSKIADTFERSSLCPIHYEAQDGAYYSVMEDKIHLPLKEAFKNNEARLSVLLHEMSHSTGHKDRLNRPLANGFGSVDYAKEELNAEISSLFLESDLGISIEPDSEMMKDHSNYIKSWISVLRDDPNELFRACANAEKITEFLMENYQKELNSESFLKLYEKAQTWANEWGTGWEGDASGNLKRLNQHYASMIARYEEENFIPKDERIINYDGQWRDTLYLECDKKEIFHINENVTKETYILAYEKAIIYNNSELDKEMNLSTNIEVEGFRGGLKV